MKFMKAIRKIVTVVLAICLCVQIITSVDMNVSAAAEPSVTYRVHCQTYGWMKTVKDGGKAGTTGKSKRLEAIRISVATGGLQGGITYRTHVQSKGWMNWVSNGAVSGTTGQSKRLEAIQIKLTGELAEKYDVYYRVHCQTYGWLDWVKNGASAGTIGQSKRLESIEIKLVKKSEQVVDTPTDEEDPYASIIYKASVQSYGWQDEVSDGASAGTTGESKRLEALNIRVNSNLSGNVVYQGHVQGIGWQSWVRDGATTGTVGKSKRLEAVKIALTGDLSDQYDVYYRVHIQSYGWLDWAKNGAIAGSTGLSKRIEAIQIQLVEKGGSAPGKTTRSYVNPSNSGTGTYSIKVNKQMNCVTIYRNGYPVKAMVCSTGNATPLGTYRTMAKYRWKLMIHNVYAQYATRIVGSILFHSVPYASPNNRTLSTSSYNKLGTTASAGCIRLTCEDAKWIYDNVPIGTTVTIYNSSNPGPLGKPTAAKIPAGQTWDPTDVTVK